MPTGYTAALCEGEQSFHDFVLDAMGAFDRGSIHDVDKPGTYHTEQQLQATTELTEVLQWSPSKRSDQYALATANARKRHAERAAKAKKTLDRLFRMRLQVSAWDPPTAQHVGLKKFMLEQLDITINSETPGVLQWPDAEEWFKRKVEHLEWKIQYHAEQQVEEEKRIAERNAWRKALWESIQEVDGDE